MIPVSFEYQKAGTVEEAIAVLSGGDGKILAGGHSLLPAMKLRLNQPSKLVDIAGISSLKGIKEDNGIIIIGAAATHAAIASSDLIKDKLPFFAEGASMIGDVQVRNYGTIGGSLAHADPAADWGALVLAAEATIKVQGSGESRDIPASDFFQGLFSTALQDGEIITAIHVPVPEDGSRTVYLKFPQPASRFALVGCAVVRHADGRTTVAFTGVADTPFRDNGAEQAASGNTLDEASIADAADAALQGVNVLSDHYASEEYRRHLAKVYLKKALRAVA